MQGRIALTVGAVGLAAAIACGAATPGDRDWPFYGGPDQTRFSPLRQINRDNVRNLKTAWSFDTGEVAGPVEETQPIMVGSTVYSLTPAGKVVALDATTGKLLWKFDPGGISQGAKRGLVYWTDGREARIFSSSRGFLYAIDARNGQAIRGFGANGRFDLREGLGRDPASLAVGLATPGVIYKDLLIIGSNMSETRGGAPGDIRALDVHTGKIRWTFHTIPHPGEFGYETWPKDAWTYAGSANNWVGMAVDQKRGMVFVPTGSASSDFFGYDRHGDNLFANSVVALKAATGERVWHFQAIKHDIWDRDFDSPPTLVTFKRDGKTIDAVAQTSKQGYLYLLERDTGKPLFPIESRRYPASTIPGELASETQGLPTKPAPLARQRLTEELLTNRTPQAHQFALDKLRTLRSDGQFLPLAVGQNTVLMPGFDGGAEWGGSAFDPETGLIYVNVNDIPWYTSLVKNEPGASASKLYLTNCASCHKENMSGEAPTIPSLVALRGGRQASAVAGVIQTGAGRMPGFPQLTPGQRIGLAEYVLGGPDKELPGGAGASDVVPYRMTGYNKFLDGDGYPGVVPPWGSLNAINLSTGDYAWKIPLGEYPELVAKGMKDTGSENYGGPVVTAGGLVFIGATIFDRKFRAFDKGTGQLLWETELPQSGNATPITYQVNGRQYVLIYASGLGRRGGDRGSDKNTTTNATYVAFALPQTESKK